MKTQYAVQFVGKDEIVINPQKPVYPVGPFDLLIKVEACGICFSDTKLLHAFDEHPRKSELVGGLDKAALEGNPSYQPGMNPTVPGHEPVVRIVEIGKEVTHFKVGERMLVQADWKHIPTQNSNGAFGYNFEGALQEYVLVDERCLVSPDGQEFLIRVSEEPTAAAIGLIEPWATVEGAYAWKDRKGIKSGGKVLICNQIADENHGLLELIDAANPEAVVLLEFSPVRSLGEDLRSYNPTIVTELTEVPEKYFDDIIYFGSDAATVEDLGKYLGTRGLINLVLCEGNLDRKVLVDVGRIHYDFIRYCGATGSSAIEGYDWIPTISDVRDGDRLLIMGAAGPMGLMHTMRNVVSGKRLISIDGTDLSDERLAHIARVIDPAAQREQIQVRYLNTDKEPLQPGYTYIVCMVPVPALVAQAVDLAGKKAIVNAFAGIPAGKSADLDLQKVVEKQIFLVGTSGSDISDMTTVVRKIEAGLYDTTISLDAITGMAGFKDAIASVINRTSGGKIMVFPQIHDLPLIRLQDLAEKLPKVAAILRNGLWTPEAEHLLLSQDTSC